MWRWLGLWRAVSLVQLVKWGSYWVSLDTTVGISRILLFQLLQATSEDVTKLAHKSKQHSNHGSVPSSRPVIWTEQHQKAVETLLDHLVSPPILGYPDFIKSFVLHTDASQEGLGAVLYQKQDVKMRVIGYCSRSLTKAEKNYYLHSGKLEFLALKLAVCEHFRDYLYHVPAFIVYTDNNPLTYVLSTAKLNATGHRWVSELAGFSFSTWTRQQGCWCTLKIANRYWFLHEIVYWKYVWKWYQGMLRGSRSIRTRRDNLGACNRQWFQLVEHGRNFYWSQRG